LKILFIAFVCNIITISAYAKSGEELFKSCVSCHGVDGNGNKAMKAPRIAGQYDWYIEATLKKFKSGERKNPQMIPFLKKLNNEDFAKLAQYISKL